MSSVLALSIPFFALIFIGMFARGIGFIGADGALTMSKFAFFVALPPMMFLNVAAGNPADILNWGFVWRYELATIALFLVGAMLARPAFQLNRLESGMFGLNVAYPNYGYMGVPLAILAFGDAAALPLALMLFADTIILLMLTAAFVVGNGGGLITAMRRTLVTMAKNPMKQVSGQSAPEVSELKSSCIGTSPRESRGGRKIMSRKDSGTLGAYGPRLRRCGLGGMGGDDRRMRSARNARPISSMKQTLQLDLGPLFKQEHPA